MKNELRSGLGMYTPNLESARESKYLALKKNKREKIKTVFIKWDYNLSKWPYDLSKIDFKLAEPVSEFRVLLENQQLDLVIQLTVSRDKFKDDARRSGVSIKAGYQRSTAACRTSYRRPFGFH